MLDVDGDTEVTHHEFISSLIRLILSGDFQHRCLLITHLNMIKQQHQTEARNVRDALSDIQQMICGLRSSIDEVKLSMTPLLGTGLTKVAPPRAHVSTPHERIEIKTLLTDGWLAPSKLGQSPSVLSSTSASTSVRNQEGVPDAEAGKPASIEARPVETASAQAGVAALAALHEALRIRETEHQPLPREGQATPSKRMPDEQPLLVHAATLSAKVLLAALPTEEVTRPKLRHATSEAASPSF